MDYGKIIIGYRNANGQSLRALAEDLNRHVKGYAFNPMTLNRMEKNLCDMPRYYLYFKQVAEGADGDLKKLAEDILAEMDKQ